MGLESCDAVIQYYSFQGYAGFKVTPLSATAWSSDSYARLRHWLCLYIYLHYYKNKNWLQFLFIVKAAVLIQQISKFYPQIQRTEASDHIYFSQRLFINVKAIFCA